MRFKPHQRHWRERGPRGRWDGETWPGTGEPGQGPSQQRPSWWPANEPWPPMSGAHRWRRGRARFKRRMALLLVGLLTLVGIGASTVVRWVFDAAGGSERHLPLRFVPFVFMALMIASMLLLTFFAVMRRVGSPMGDIVSAAHRVGSGDYGVRLEERGPRFLRVVARSFNSMTAQLESQDQQRRQLMADIAHELRTPLSVIQGRLEGLVDGVYPRDEARMAELLEDTRMLTRLVDDLRTLANAEAGNLPLRKEPTDLSVLLHDSVASFAAEARDTQIDLRVEEATELPLVEIDPLRIREVLTNLIANAVRHTSAGGRILVTAEAEAAAGRVQVAVVDTGSGIPPEELPRIFDRFYKGASSRGSGLGLTIARNLVLAHGGQISADSQPGRGTRIQFNLPVKSPEMEL
jgi:signal transduction histidine kinase